MRIRNCVLMLFVFTSAYSMGQTCQGDCQTGAIAGPYSAAQAGTETSSKASTPSRTSATSINSTNRIITTSTPILPWAQP
jgi:hypothetical protein